MTKPSNTDERLSLPLALAAIVPMAVAFIALAVFVVGEAGGARPFAVAPEVNVAEAVAWGDAGQALAFIMSGQDPNRRWPVRRELLDARGVVHVTAIQAAILSRRPELVGLMVRQGARPDTPEGLACLVQALSIGDKVSPSLFGIPGATYYTGPELHGIAALDACGLPSE